MYAFNKKAWMTSSIFEDWLRKLDRRFKTQRHQVLMVVDNCPAHPKLNNLEAITLVFLPPNTTSRLHLCDMGIIKNLKVKYQKLVARRFLDSIENKTVSDINVLDAMQMLRSAWRDVMAQTVANCFHQAGFAATLCNGADDSLDPPAVQAQEEEDTLRRFLYAAPSSDAAQEQLMSVESFVVYGRRRYTPAALTDYFTSNR